MAVQEVQLLRRSSWSLLILLAACALLYRDAWLPPSARPEAYRFVAGRLQRVDRSETYLAGQPHLLFSDSQGGACPWVADVLYFPVASADETAGAMDFHCGDLRYEQIIVWWGTGHFARGYSVDEYLRVMDAVIASARRRTRRLFIIGPVAAPPDSGGARKDSKLVIAEAFSALRQRHPDLPMYDMGEFWRDIPENGGAKKLLLPDQVHVSDAGYDILGRELAELGFRIPPRRE